MEFEILSVDDQEMDRKILSMFLSKVFPGIKIHEAVNGQDAIEFILNYNEELKNKDSEKIPLVIFLDINMPVMNGFEFLKEFEDNIASQIDRIKPLIVNMLTSSKDEDDINRAKSFSCL